MFNTLLIVVDINDLEKSVEIVNAAKEITACHVDPIYRVITVIEPMDGSLISSFLPRGFDKSVIEEANKRLHKFTEDNFSDDAKVQHIVAHGSINEEVSRIAESLEVDLIIMQAQDNPDEKGLSTDALKVTKYCDKPILLLR